jgi:enamine deaminase RidA (YjgF/YER057c/UK114 family)
VVKLTGFVNATPDFTDHPKVINGASDLLVEVFGEAGRHARSAVGSVSLPLGVAVEVEGIFEIA